MAFLLLAGTASGAGFVMVSGIDPANETVTVMNTAFVPADLGGWWIGDSGGAHTFVFPPFTLPGQATVTVHTGQGTNTLTDLYWGLPAGTAVWSATGAVATLYNPSGTRISDSGGYQAPTDTSALPRYAEGDIIRYQVGGPVTTWLVVSVVPNGDDPVYRTYGIVRANGTWTIPRFATGWTRST